MTGQVCDWLPLEVVDREPVRTAIAGAISEWAAAWFGAPRLSASRFTPTRSGRPDDAAGWRVHRKALAVSCSGRAMGRLLDWALDADVEQLSLSPADRRLVEAFEGRLMQDLALRVETALKMDGELKSQPLSVDDPYGRFGGLNVEVTDDRGGVLLSLAIPFTDLLPTCKASLPAIRRSAVKLDTLRSALADAALPVKATLGAARIALADLHSLAPGDVLVLDTALDDGAALSLGGSAHVFAAARLTDHEGKMTLTLQA